MAWGYVDYTYSNENEFNKHLVWLTINSGTCKVYFALRAKDTDAWSYFGGVGESDHTLTGGTTLVAKTSENLAKSEFWTPVPDSDKFDSARLPSPMYAKYVRMYVEDVADIDIHEWKPSSRLRADEILGGKLTVDNVQIDKIPYVDARRKGTSTNAQTIIDTVASIGSDDRTMLVPPYTWDIDQDVTIATNIETKVQHGAYFDISAGMEITFNGPVVAGRSNIFSTTGTVTFGSQSGQSLKPEWWGALPDGSTDSTEAIQICLNKMQGRTVDFDTTTDTEPYKITSPLSVPGVQGWELSGHGRAGTKIVQYTDATPIFEIGTGHGTHSWSMHGLYLAWDNQQSSTMTDSYGIQFKSWSDDTYGTVYLGTIRDMRISKGYRAIGIDDKVGDQIAVWQMSIENIFVDCHRAEGLYFKSPTAVGMPNNTFDNIYITQRNATPYEPAIKIHTNSEGVLRNCAVEGSRGCAVYLSGNPTFSVQDMHIESATLTDAVGNYLINISETDLLWDGGSISIDTVDTTTQCEIFRFYTGGSYNNAVIRGVREKATSVTGDYYFIYSLNDDYVIDLQRNYLQNATKYKDLSETQENLRLEDGVFSRHQYTYTSETLTNSGTSFLFPGVGGADIAVTLPDGDIVNQRKLIRKEGNNTYKATLTITTHKLGTITREFNDQKSFMELVWNGSYWTTVVECLDEGMYVSPGGSISNNGSGALSLVANTGDVDLTLGDPDRPGTWKLFTLSTATHDAHITVTNHAEGASKVFTLTDTHDSVLFRWTRHRWVTISEYPDPNAKVGDNGQVQYNNGTLMGGADIWYDDTNERTGFGVATPLTTVHAKDSGDSNFTIETSTEGAGGYAGFKFYAPVGGTSTQQGFYRWDDEHDKFVVYTNNKKLHLWTNNVGIGANASNPAYKLQIDGDIAPYSTEKQFGAAALRWNVYAHDLDVNGSITSGGSKVWSGTVNYLDNTSASQTLTVINGMITACSE